MIDLNLSDFDAEKIAWVIDRLYWNILKPVTTPIERRALLELSDRLKNALIENEIQSLSTKMREAK